MAPLVTDETRERSGEGRSTEKSQGSRGGDAQFDVKIPGFGGVGGGGRGSQLSADEAMSSTSARTIQNFTYSQAYYLYLIRGALAERGLLNSVSSADDAAGLRSGDFVEYRATFRPNELHVLLDILTPDVVGAIVRHQAKSVAVAGWPESPTTDELQAFVAKVEFQAQSKVDLARAAVEAVRVDFRAQKTREFYGRIGNSITAITICDVPHFVVDDEDRILDGEFTVLGKVTSGVAVDVPVLGRNKLLSRLGPVAVDEVVGSLRRSASEQVERIPIGDAELKADEAFDVAFASRIHGPSFRVVPIAIYA